MGYGNMDYGNMSYGGMGHNGMSYANGRPVYTWRGSNSGRGNRYAGLRRSKRCLPAIFPLHLQLILLVFYVGCAENDPELCYDDWRGTLTGLYSLDRARNRRF
ncbi:hypothetical protein EJ03DRAFT_333234 [Teratosphaeria nubilosa]|uniref:Uncharacterized protein n=1 Tax=Teratosphaeria nubilosa TaxID=161662 RepID=A0A6G1LKV5_9PEZI|nr:hypothetical protein EJ03DRAFT_333234 [Teratosphaeria nubilosa]